MSYQNKSELLAAALKEVDDIMKNNEFMLSRVGPDNRSGVSLPTNPSLLDPTRLDESSLRDPHLHHLPLSSGGSLAGTSITQQKLIRGPQDPGPDSDEAVAAFLSDLRTCVSEVSNVREVFRDISSENQVMLKHLHILETPVTSTTSHRTNLLSSSRPSWLASSGTGVSLPTSGGPSMGIGAVHLDRLASLEEERRYLQDQVTFLTAEMDVHKERSRRLEAARENQSTGSGEVDDLLDQISTLSHEINSLSLEKKDLQQTVTEQLTEMEELKMRLRQQESELTCLRSLHQRDSNSFESSVDSSDNKNINDDDQSTNSMKLPGQTTMNGATPDSGMDEDRIVLTANDDFRRTDSPLPEIDYWEKNNSMEELRTIPPSIAVVPPLTPPTRPRYLVNPGGRPTGLPRKVNNFGSIPRPTVDLGGDPDLRLEKFIRRIVDASEFSQWTCERVMVWLRHLGLDGYTQSCRRWVRSGSQLLAASKKEIEKELGIRNSLHLKKLMLYLRAIQSPHDQSPTFIIDIPASFSLNKWLDDIGLLHYLSGFQASGMDPNLINQITMEDLSQLKITNELHLLSLKRGIQVLRHLHFDLDRLIRRPTQPDPRPESSAGGEGEAVTVVGPSPLQVLLWSHHQVMDWLRRIELPEYSSNLRGSGIHGGLLILEDRFNADLLACLLNISADKTLLRRHLSLHFQTLIGPHVHSRKRDCESSPDYQPLTLTAKVKLIRRRPSFFYTRRRKNSGSECGEESLLCPVRADGVTISELLQETST